MNDFILICGLAVFVAFLTIILPRTLSSLRGPDFTRRGEYEPRYDDPNIRSRGSFGRGWTSGRSRAAAGSDQPQYNSPRVRSRGSFGRSKD
ncbi:MAG: hypothetical protein K8J31_23880 [Anaerolineae bacterium]|nr:hypothetical protein [Anaerolineae bacterium]